MSIPDCTHNVSLKEFLTFFIELRSPLTFIDLSNPRFRLFRFFHLQYRLIFRTRNLSFVGVPLSDAVPPYFFDWLSLEEAEKADNYFHAAACSMYVQGKSLACLQGPPTVLQIPIITGRRVRCLQKHRTSLRTPCSATVSTNKGRHECGGRMKDLLFFLSFRSVLTWRVHRDFFESTYVSERSLLAFRTIYIHPAVEQPSESLLRKELNRRQRTPRCNCRNYRWCSRRKRGLTSLTFLFRRTKDHTFNDF